jgi:hypothetical protein
MLDPFAIMFEVVCHHDRDDRWTAATDRPGEMTLSPGKAPAMARYVDPRRTSALLMVAVADAPSPSQT